MRVGWYERGAGGSLGFEFVDSHSAGEFSEDRGN